MTSFFILLKLDKPTRPLIISGHDDAVHRRVDPRCPKALKDSLVAHALAFTESYAFGFRE